MTRVKVEFSKPDPEAGKAALGALEKAIEEFREGLIDVIVTAPINKHTIQSEGFAFPGHTEYIEQRLGNGSKITDDPDERGFPGSFGNRTYSGSRDSLFNNQGTDSGETCHIQPVVETGFRDWCAAHRSVGTESACRRRRIARYGRTGNHFSCYSGNGCQGESCAMALIRLTDLWDRAILPILTEYWPCTTIRGLAPFKALAMDEGVNYTAGLPVIRTSPAHGTAYDIAGKGVACEDSFRQAIYVAIDVFRNRQREKEAHANPLRKQYYEKRDDSDKLKLDTVDDDI